MRPFKLFTILLLAFALTGMSAAGCSDDPDAWEASHNAIQPGEEVMNAIGLQPGMVIGEIGAGRGRYAVQLAGRVGEAGKVYANDIDEDKIDYLRQRCERDSIENIISVLGRETEPLFPEASLDIVFMVNTYHHLSEPTELLKNTLPALKPEGRLAIVEHCPEKYPEAHESHTTPKETVIEQVEAAGFELVRVETFLERDNIYVFRIQEKGK